MKKKPDSPADPAVLRRRAEQRLQTRQRTPNSELLNPQSAIRNPQSTPRLVHELQVHQIELEMQNEELRATHAKLETTLAQYTDLYDFAPVGYLTLNEPGLIQEANLTAANLLGVARSELRQRPLGRFILRADADIYERHRQQLLETRAPHSCELRMKRPGATPFWVRLEASVPPGGDGAPPAYRATLSDITRHKQAEADRERLAQLERLAQVMKCASDVILLTAEDGRILEANDRALETYGYSLAELRQKTVEDLRTPESRAELPHQAEQLETDGRAVFEAMNQRRDGVAFPVEISARFLEIAGVRYRLSIVRDITERKRAQEALREASLFNQQIVHGASEGIVVCGRDHRYQAWNPYMEHLTGLAAAQVLGRLPLEVFPFLGEAGLMERLERALAGETLPLVDFPYHIPQTGRSGWVSHNCAGLRNAQGEIIGTIVTVHDITERRLAELALREMNEHLAVRVQERTAELVQVNRTLQTEMAERKQAQVALQKAHDELEQRVAERTDELRRANEELRTEITERKQAQKRVQMLSQEIIVAREEERKQVSSVLHHDVGSLAVGIAAHLDALEEDLRSGRAREALKWMRRTRKLFDQSVVRLKKLAIELRPPELDVLGLCAALRQHFAQAAERGGVRIHFRDTLGRRRVSGDTATILFRIAQEALTNAVTHGHATRVAVGLSASKTEVALTVRNNGKAFDPSRKSGRVKPHLGLRVMREMALSAGGAFAVDSGRGKATTVRACLPIAD